MRLRQEFKLYRHWSSALGEAAERDAASEHRLLADAAISRDGEQAVERLAAHIAAPADRLITMVLAGQLPSDDTDAAIPSSS